MPRRIVQSHTEASGDLVAYEFGIDLIPTSHVVSGGDALPAGLVVSNDLIVGYGNLNIESVIEPSFPVDCQLPIDLRPLVDGGQLIISWDESESESGFALVMFGMGEVNPYITIDFPDTRHPSVGDTFDMTGVVRLRA